MKKISALLALAMVIGLFAVLVPTTEVAAAHPKFEEFKKVGEQKRKEEAAAAAAAEEDNEIKCCPSYVTFYGRPGVIAFDSEQSRFMSFDGGLHFYEIVDGQAVLSPWYNVYPFGYSYYYSPVYWSYYNWYTPYYYAPYYVHPYFVGH